MLQCRVGCHIMSSVLIIVVHLKRWKGDIMITIDYQNRAPIYEQIVERFQTLILKGILPPGSQMPSVRSLAMELSINPNTIQKAYTALEQQGYIYPVKGRGNFVTENDELLEQKKENFLDKLREILEEGMELGITKKECERVLDMCWKGEEFV